eukprot:g10368.t1
MKKDLVVNALREKVQQADNERRRLGRIDAQMQRLDAREQTEIAALRAQVEQCATRLGVLNKEAEVKKQALDKATTEYVEVSERLQDAQLEKKELEDSLVEMILQSGKKKDDELNKLLCQIETEENGDAMSWPLLLPAAGSYGYESSPSTGAEHKQPHVQQVSHLIGVAPTGTGKTLAYLLPLLANVLASPERSTKKHTLPPLALVLLPTRELCCQNKKLYDQFHPRIRSAGVFGGNSKAKQIFALNRGCDLLLATPGRLNDLLAEAAVGVVAPWAGAGAATASGATTPEARKGNKGAEKKGSGKKGKGKKGQTAVDAGLDGEEHKHEQGEAEADLEPKADVETADAEGDQQSENNKPHEFLVLRKDLLAQVEVIVVDEADRMLDLGFEPQLRKIFKSTESAVTEGVKPKKSKSKTSPAVSRKQARSFRCWFFSASWPATSDKLARAIANSHAADPNSETTETATSDDQFVYVEVGHERKTTRTSPKEENKEKAAQEDCDLIAAADTDAGTRTESSPASTPASSCRQEFVIFEADKRGFTKSEEKLDRLVQIITAHPSERILVFCNMKKTVTWLQEKLLEKLNETVPPEGGAKTWNRMSVRGMHSDLSQEKRCDTYLKFKTNKFKILLATDIAARGLNIVGLNVVVNFDSAEQGEDHLHRIGRCGRGAGLVRKAKTWRSRMLQRAVAHPLRGTGKTKGSAQLQQQRAKAETRAAAAQPRVHD